MDQGVPAEFAARRAGVEVGASHRITISQYGLYRITYSNLLAAGVSNPVGSDLRLFCRTQEVALTTSSEGVWSNADYAIFFGWPHDGYYTTSNVFWLGLGGPGLRMDVRSGLARPDAPEQTTHTAVATHSPDAIRASTYRPTDGSFDHWFAMTLVNSSQTNFQIYTLDRLATGNATVTLGLWGRSSSGAFNPDHATRFTINNLGTHTSYYDGLTYHEDAFTVAQSALSNGLNTVGLRQMVTDVSDNASLQWARIEYQASNRVNWGLLGFPGLAGSNNYTCAPWNTNLAPWLIDLSQVYRPVRVLDPEVSSGGSTGQVRWGDAPASAPYYWLSEPGMLSDVPIGPAVVFKGLAATNRQADYIMIVDTNLGKSAYRLARQRATQGLRPLIVNIGDIYDEFSYGIKDAGAIKQFIGYAFHHWDDPPPRYVVLVGDGSYDPRNNLGLGGASDLIPVHLGPSPNEYCALDGWFATVNGNDYLTDVSLGRFPVSSDAQMSNAVAKILSFEAAAANAPWRKKALCVADQSDGLNNFPAASDTHAVTNLVRAGLTTITKAYYAGNTATTRQTITNTINSGIFTVSYFGHGYTDIWAVGFDTNDVAKLNNNAVWPVFNVLTCENGAFDNPTTECLTEKLLERNQRGAVATASASALSLQAAAEQFASGFYSSLTNGAPNLRLGDAMDGGFLRLWGLSPNSEELLFYGLFGDPAQVIRP